MKMTKREYQAMSKKASPPSPIVKNCIKAFLIGGTICAVGQVAINLATNEGMTTKEARMLCCVVLIAASVLLTALDVYDSLAKHAGAGTLVPITGFANAVASPAIDSHSEGLILGVGAKIFTVAGPVLLYGTLAGAVYGVILWLFDVINI